jgi:hypothetical protein
MFTPNLDLAVVTRCSKFRIYDKTGIDTGDGKGWNAATGPSAAILSSAIVQIIKPDLTFSDVDVLSQIPTPVAGEFLFSDVTGTYVDGLYNLVYKLKTTDITILSYIDYSAIVSGTTKINSVAHGITTGMFISITGTTNYNGDFYATKVNDDNLYITKTFVVDDGVSTGTKMYQSTFYPYVYCRAEAGITTLYANISRMVEGPVRDKYMDEANTLNGLLNSLKSSITSSNTDALDNLLAEINQLLAFREIEVNF